MTVPRRAMREDQEARALWQWAQYQPLLRRYLYHVPNGGRRGKIEAARLAGQGVRAGVSDWHLPVPRGGFAGLWVEFKAAPPHSAQTTSAQRHWQVDMAELGHAAYVCRGVDEAKAVFEWYLTLPALAHIVECPPLSAIVYGLSDAG